MKTYALIAADLFAVLAVTFMATLGVLAPLVHTEVLSYIEQNRTDKKSDAAAPEAQDTVLLEVLYGEEGAIRYTLSSESNLKQDYTRYQNLVAAIERQRPQDIRIRVDRRVESGIYQDILLDTGKLGIRVWQANEAK